MKGGSRAKTITKVYCLAIITVSGMALVDVLSLKSQPLLIGNLPQEPPETTSPVVLELKISNKYFFSIHHMLPGVKSISL